MADESVSRPRGVARPIAALVRFYQLAISPMRGPSCRYAPTCSEYAVEALTAHGAWRGSYLAVRRLLRCHPFHEGGYDPVPSPKARRAAHLRHAAAVTAVPSQAPPRLPLAGAAPVTHPATSSKEAGECLC